MDYPGRTERQRLIAAGLLRPGLLTLDDATRAGMARTLWPETIVDPEHFRRATVGRRLRADGETRRSEQRDPEAA